VCAAFFRTRARRRFRLPHRSSAHPAPLPLIGEWGRSAARENGSQRLLPGGTPLSLGQLAETGAQHTLFGVGGEFPESDGFFLDERKILREKARQQKGHLFSPLPLTTYELKRAGANSTAAASLFLVRESGHRCRTGEKKKKKNRSGQIRPSEQTRPPGIGSHRRVELSSDLRSFSTATVC